MLNIETREVFVDGKNVYFTSKEFDILLLLINNANKVVSKDKIFKEVWHEEFCMDTQTVTVHIKNIRKKFSIMLFNESNLDSIIPMYSFLFKASISSILISCK